MKISKVQVFLIAAAFVFALCSISADAAPLSDADFIELCKNGTPLEIAQAIQAGANVKASNDVNENALHFASRDNRDHRAIEVLIAHGADVNFADDDDWTALHYATYSNANPDIVRVLLENGANVEVRDNHDETPLMNAARRNSPRHISLLLDAGADANAATDSGWTALHFATLNNDDPEVVKTLLERGANIEAKDSDGDTPLMNAVMAGKFRSAIVLLDHGADVTVTNRHGRTAADFLPDARPEGFSEAEWEALSQRLSQLTRTSAAGNF